MKNLNCIPDTTNTDGTSNNYFKYYSDIVDEKYNPSKTALQAIASNVQIKYGEYVHAFNTNSLQTLTAHTFSPSEKKDLQSCYKSTQPYFSLEKAIYDAQDKWGKGICQYCGIGKPKSIDHYLPQTRFPEFSVIALNLVPCCASCNSTKNQYWIDSVTKQREIINFYIDDINRFEFLSASIGLKSSIPSISFNIQQPQGMSNSLFFIISRHFDRLGLLQQYNEESALEIDEIINSFRVHHDGTLSTTEITSILNSDILRLASNYGRNYWKAVLRKAIIASNALLQNFYTIQL